MNNILIRIMLKIFFIRSNISHVSKFAGFKYFLSLTTKEYFGCVIF